MGFIDDTVTISEKVKEALGYYLILYVNKTKHKIRDSNKDTVRKIYGKTVILPHGVSIKHGKYEGGHVGRRILDLEHLKKGGADINGESVFFDVFKKSFNLVEDNCSKSDLKKLEGDLNKEVKKYLDDNRKSITSEVKINGWIDKSGSVEHCSLNESSVEERLLEKHDFRKNYGDWRQIDLSTKDNPEDTIVKAEELIESLKNYLEPKVVLYYGRS